MALSGNSVAVGDPADCYGGPFVMDINLGESRCQLKGVYRSDGLTENVDLEVVPNPQDVGKLRWLRFGPFNAPLSSSANRIGQFVGTVTCANVYADGQRRESTPLSATIEVEPSIVGTDLQPIGASCPSPARRALDGFAYRLACQAVGFSPTGFTVRLKTDVRTMEPARWQLPAQGGGFSLADTGGGQLAIDPIPEDRQRYVAELSISATSSDDSRHQVVLPLSVHRPIEVIYATEPRIAQFYHPEAVTGCLPGGFTGNSVSSSEATVDSRSRGFATSFSQSWLNSRTTGTSTTNTVSNSTALSNMTGTSLTVPRNTDNGWQREGTFNLDLLGLAGSSLGGNQTGKEQNGTSSVNSSSQTVGSSRSTSDSVTRMDEASTALGRGVSNTGAKEVSGANAVERGSSQLIVPGNFGVWYRQAQRWRRRGQ
jgi:hypothetical protein